MFVHYISASKEQAAYKSCARCILSGRIFSLFKLEKMLEKITTLDNEAYLNVRLFDLTEKRKLLVEKKVPFGALLLENMQLEACIELDPNFCELFGELISKISPGFDQSPLMGFMDLFSEAGINLEYFSFDTDSKILRV